jgi:hypothetical protein
LSHLLQIDAAFAGAYKSCAIIGTLMETSATELLFDNSGARWPAD